MSKILKIFIAFGCGLCLTLSAFSQQLPKARPGSVGMSDNHLQRLDDIIQTAINKRDFPGAVIVVGRKGKIVFRKAYGECQWVPKSRSMQLNMLFDVASMTKPIATATSIMLLVEQGKIRLWDKISDFIPDYMPYEPKDEEEEEEEVEETRIWHLLTHTSGLLSYLRNEEIEENLGSSPELEELVQYIAGTEKENPPGEEFIYSDLGFILLGYIVEEVTDQTLAEFARKNIFLPLKMRNTGFNPPERLQSKCVPTEVVEEELLIGKVHDPRARMIGGIAGHAGLFSTGDDLSVFAQMMLNRGKFKKVRLLSPLTVDRMTELFAAVDYSGRGIGWDLNSDYSTNSGDLFGPNAFGHTGYTGTSITIDPDTETFVIFLTNRVHPDDTGNVATWRSRVANVVAASILK